MSSNPERGAAAVEFALLLPVLITLVFGIIEFAWAFNAQVTLTNAAREGVRVMAISTDTTTAQAKARAAAKNAASHLNPPLADGNIAFSAEKCSSGAQMTVTVNYNHATITGIAGSFALRGKGTMLCGG